MKFLNEFVTIALAVQIMALALLAINLGSKALHRALYERWQRLTGRKSARSSHGS